MSTTLAHVHRTAGAPRSLAQRDLVVFGRIEGSGARATFTWRFGEGGRFLRDSTGVRGRCFGCDGVEVWLHDVAGRSRVLELGEDHIARLLSAALSGQWVDPPHDFTVGEAPDTVGGAPNLILALGHGRARLEIARETGDLRGLDLGLAFRREHWTLEDHLTLGGIRYPRTLVRQRPGGPAETFVVERAALEPPLPPSDYQCPAGGEHTRFDRSISAELRVDRAPNGFLLVHPRIDGRDAGTFVFDTGAGGNIIAPQVADELGLARAGDSWLGMAAGQTAAGIRTSGSLALGPLTIEQPAFTEMEFGPLSQHAQVEITGLIGYDVLARAVVELELERSRIALFDPATFELPGASWQELAIAGAHPYVKGSFESHAGWFRLDSGAPQVAVILNVPTIERFQLLEGRTVQKERATLPGGEMDIALGLVADVIIGGHCFEPLTALFPLESGGAFDDPYTLGNLGQECLKPFRAVFDYRHRRIALIDRAQQP
jgi:aspartyl protease